MKIILLLLTTLLLHCNVNAQGVERIYFGHSLRPFNTICEEDDCTNGQVAYQLMDELSQFYVAMYNGELKDSLPNGKGIIICMQVLDKANNKPIDEEGLYQYVSMEGVFKGFEFDGLSTYGRSTDDLQKNSDFYTYTGKAKFGIPQNNAVGKTLGDWESTIDVFRFNENLGRPDSIRITYRNSDRYYGNAHSLRVGIPGSKGVYDGYEYDVEINNETVKYSNDTIVKSINYSGKIAWRNGDTFNGDFKLSETQTASGTLKFLPTNGNIDYANGEKFAGTFDKNGLPYKPENIEGSEALYERAVQAFDRKRNASGCEYLKRAYQLNINNENVNELMKSKCQ